MATTAGGSWTSTRSSSPACPSACATQRCCSTTHPVLRSSRLPRSPPSRTPARPPLPLAPAAVTTQATPLCRQAAPLAWIGTTCTSQALTSAEWRGTPAGMASTTQALGALYGQGSGSSTSGQRSQASRGSGNSAASLCAQACRMPPGQTANPRSTMAQGTVGTSRRPRMGRSASFGTSHSPAFLGISRGAAAGTPEGRCLPLAASPVASGPNATSRCAPSK
mmetsp:Transcript_26070/g.72998  ORF Transcript_26070/g.72998 Transcript_26070/m.72998 type:complete len:222 (-) Transcript_26070:1677-2342(-)